MKRMTNKSKIILVFLFVLVVAVFKDISSETIKEGKINRGEIGSSGKEMELRLDAERLLENYTYSLDVVPTRPTEEMAETYFAKAITEIDKEFEHVNTNILIRKHLCEGLVKANWSFQPFGIIDSDGNVDVSKLEEEETIVQAQVELTCGAYERLYTFSFLLERPILSEEELLLQQIQERISSQMSKEGSSVIELPKEIDGNQLKWSEKKEYLTPQVLVLEIISLLLLWLFTKRKQKEEEEKRRREMEKDYADIVSQLSLLLGAGMTAKQAWNRMAMQYIFKRKHKMMPERLVYEAILRMNGRFAEGVSERVAYQKFREEIPAPCYHKLIRILLGNLEKGIQDVSMSLGEESRLAFEQKIMQVKKQGEEASTKMLGPLMFMMLIIMGIIMFPALMEFKF